MFNCGVKINIKEAIIIRSTLIECSGWRRCVCSSDVKVINLMNIYVDRILLLRRWLVNV